jgi:hypothetical protein
MILAGHVRGEGEKGHAYRSLVTNLNERGKWKNNIKMDLR